MTEGFVPLSDEVVANLPQSRHVWGRLARYASYAVASALFISMNHKDVDELDTSSAGTEVIDNVNGPADNVMLAPAERIPQMIVAPEEYTIPEEERQQAIDDTFLIGGGCTASYLRTPSKVILGFVTSGHCFPGMNGKTIGVNTPDGLATSAPLLDRCNYNSTIYKCTAENGIDILYGGLNGHSSEEVEAQLKEYYDSINWDTLPANATVLMVGIPYYNNPNKDKIAYELSYAGSTKWVNSNNFVVTFGNWSVNDHSCSRRSSGGLGRILYPGVGFIPFGDLALMVEFNPVITMSESNPNFTLENGKSIFRDFNFYFNGKVGDVEYMCGFEDPYFN